MHSHQQTFARHRALQRAALLPIVLAAVLAAGCNKDSKDGGKASQAAARVNGEELTVHQINLILERQQGIKPEQAEQASRQILEGLIDQELAVQKAVDQKMDRDPQIVQMLDAARRSILGRAYLEKTAQAAVGAPSADDVKKYYNDHPALFAQRRIYMLQDFSIQGDQAQIADVMPKLQATNSSQAFVDALKASGLKFAVNQVTQPAEALPLNVVDKFNTIKDGEGMYQPLNGGLKVVLVAASKQQPLTMDQAKPLIERFLTESRRQEFIQKEAKNLRTSAKIEYIGKFADKAASGVAGTASGGTAPAAAPAASVAATPAPAASGGLDANSLSKGLSGLK
ncbi:MAG: EpsD family peptidyl-prolyl cis-trans isomerase [Burkholderiales bacterium]|nr:EpsD family peptidyl-prolyl cis-trans isomerase [Burkholderiales bacterium]